MNRERSKIETPARSAKVAYVWRRYMGGGSAKCRLRSAPAAPRGAGKSNGRSDRSRRSSASSATACRGKAQWIVDTALRRVDLDQLPGNGPVEHLSKRLRRLETVPIRQRPLPGTDPLRAQVDQSHIAEGSRCLPEQHVVIGFYENDQSARTILKP